MVLNVMVSESMFFSLSRMIAVFPVPAGQTIKPGSRVYSGQKIVLAGKSLNAAHIAIERHKANSKAYSVTRKPSSLFKEQKALHLQEWLARSAHLCCPQT